MMKSGFSLSFALVASLLGAPAAQAFPVPAYVHLTHVGVTVSVTNPYTGVIGCVAGKTLSRGGNSTELIGNGEWIS